MSTLASGSRLGPYEVLGPLGAGGMGEVYRAKDLKLGREVAIKILPELFASDPDRLARFQREAQVLASLNHPNIAAIYGLEESDSSTGSGQAGTKALVLELVPGETLADRIARGPIPLDEALPIAKQIAEALEAAHEQGIIHRDLKPANIKITPDGVVKVLDFGLAKLAQPMGAGASLSPLSMSPTITSPAIVTGVGVLLGTAPYMSPEQAKGREADKRSDVWAFGCVLYEMLTGKRAFDGEDVADTLASVLKGEVDWAALPPLPPAVLGVLKRTLLRDRPLRLRDLSAASFVLDPSFGSSQPPSEAQLRTKGLSAIVSAVAVTAVLASALTFVGIRARFTSAAVQPVTRFTIDFPKDEQWTLLNKRAVAIASDGTRIAYVAQGHLYVRALSDFEAKTIAGDGVTPLNSIAFSPDGQSITYWWGGDGTRKRVPAEGGSTVTVGRGGDWGVSWSEDGIITVQGGSGAGWIPVNRSIERIVRLKGDGATEELLLTGGQGELIADPEVLPGGWVMFAVVRQNLNPTWKNSAIAVERIGGGDRRIVVEHGTAPHYSTDGRLFYANGGRVFAVKFDVSSMRVTGRPVAVLDGVRGVSTTGGAQYAVSKVGSVAYIPGNPNAIAGERNLVLTNTRGEVRPLRIAAGSFAAPRVSPDGHWIAYQRDDGESSQVWIYDMRGGTQPRQLTVKGNNRLPVWSPDSAQLVFQSDRAGDLALYTQTADGVRDAERLTKPAPGLAHLPDSWSRDGRTLLYEEVRGETYTLWRLSTADRSVAQVPDISGTWPHSATFSPDGRWFVYGANGLSVQPFPPTGAVFTLSSISVNGSTGSHHAVWSRDQRQLFLIPGSTAFAAVDVQLSPTVDIGAPKVFQPRITNSHPSGFRDYDVTPDGAIVGISDIETDGADGTSLPPMRVIQNWSSELERLVPTK